MLKKVLIILFASLILCNLFLGNVYSSNKKKLPGFPIEYEASNEKFIKKNYKSGEYISIPQDKLKKILIGAWEIEPNLFVIFRRNGNFNIYNLEKNGKMVNLGRWKTKDNVLFLLLKDTDKWQKWKIKKMKIRKFSSKSIIHKYSCEITIDASELKNNYNSKNFIFDTALYMIFN